MFSSDQESQPHSGETNGQASGRAYETVPDWQQIGTFVAGLGIGAAIGAAAALLWAPASGAETRGKIRRKFSREEESLWDSLGQELRRAAAKRKPLDEEEVEELEEFEVLTDRD